MHQGDLVQVTLVNDDVEDGVTIHWHGVDVPNAEDGVAGVTQDAVRPGGALRLPLPRRAGRDVLVPQPSGLVRRGRARPLRRDRRRAARPEPGGSGPDARRARRRRHARDERRLTTSRPRRCGRARRSACASSTRRARRSASGCPGRRSACWRSTAPTCTSPASIQATDARARRGRPLRRRLRHAGAARRGRAHRRAARIVLSPDGRTNAPQVTAGTRFDPLGYGEPAPTPFGADSHFDRSFQLRSRRSSASSTASRAATGR